METGLRWLLSEPHTATWHARFPEVPRPYRMALSYSRFDKHPANRRRERKVEDHEGNFDVMTLEVMYIILTHNSPARTQAQGPTWTQRCWENSPRIGSHLSAKTPHQERGVNFCEQEGISDAAEHTTELKGTICKIAYTI